MRLLRRRRRRHRQTARAPSTEADLVDIRRVVSRLSEERTELRHTLSSVHTGGAYALIGVEHVAVGDVARRLRDVEILLHTAQHRRASVAKALRQTSGVQISPEDEGTA